MTDLSAHNLLNITCNQSYKLQSSENQIYSLNHSQTAYGWVIFK